MRFAERIKLFPVLAGETWRRARLRFKSSPYSGISLPIAPLPKQYCIPADTRPTQPELAADYYSGLFLFADHMVDLKGDSPFTAKPNHEAWERELHGFRWLRHLVAAESALARAQGSAFLADWIRTCSRAQAPRAFEPGVIADRLIAWTCHGSVLLQDAGPEARLEMRRSMAEQSRLLQNLQSTLAVDATRLKAIIALAYVALCFGARGKVMRVPQRDLAREIDRQILPDGGHVSRNPGVLVDLLADMKPLLDAHVRMGQEPGAELISAVDRMMGALRFFRHCDGTLAQFNGTGVPSRPLLDSLMSGASSGTSLPSVPVQQSAPFTGYERLGTGGTVVIMDTGAPLLRSSSGDAAAGCLAFELSSGKNRFIINSGKPVVDVKSYDPFWRMTAAHSTATIGVRSSARFAKSARLAEALPAPILAWPQKVTKERWIDDGKLTIDASHDGYVRSQGLIHRRIVQLGENGRMLNGADRFEPVDPRQRSGDGAEIVLRFHLPPTVSASRLANGHSILIAAPDKEAWTFTCIDAPIALEESICFAQSDGPRKTEQIVVRARANRHAEIRWTMQRRPKKVASRSKAQDTALPDLLTRLDESEPAE